MRPTTSEPPRPADRSWPGNASAGAASRSRCPAVLHPLALDEAAATPVSPSRAAAVAPGAGVRARRWAHDRGRTRRPAARPRHGASDRPAARDVDATGVDACGSPRSIVNIGEGPFETRAVAQLRAADHRCRSSSGSTTHPAATGSSPRTRSPRTRVMVTIIGMSSASPDTRCTTSRRPARPSLVARRSASASSTRARIG